MSSEAERRMEQQSQVYFLVVKQDCEQSLIFLLRHGRMRARETRARARASGEAARNEDGAGPKKKFSPPQALLLFCHEFA